MKLFFDTEFTGLVKNTDLISICIVSENNEDIFYAELTDFNIDKVNKWIYDNVISNLVFMDARYNKLDRGIYLMNLFQKYGYKYPEFYVGTKKDISKKLLNWINRLYKKYDIKSYIEQIQFISDVSHYDTVLLFDLLTNGGSALDLPKIISPVVTDINPLIAREYGTTEYNAFDMCREKISTIKVSDDITKILGKHNSLYDAMVIKNNYYTLMS